MPEIALTEEQSRIVAMAKTAVIVRASSGTALGAIDPKELEVIAEAKRRLGCERGQGISRIQVEAHFAALQAERERLGDRFDAEYMKRFLKKLRSEDGRDE